MKYYFIYKKYKYANLLMLDFNRQVQIYKDTKKINDVIYNYNKNFSLDYEAKIGTVDLENIDIRKINGNIYAKLEKENVRKALTFYQAITIL